MERYLGKFYAKGWTLCKGCGGDILKSEGNYCTACGPHGSLANAKRSQTMLEKNLKSTLKKGKYHR